MTTTFVGLSGGVDSAVSAALLKEQGHRVIGCFIKIWQPEFIECTWREDRLDAMRVCAALQIPFREIDLSEVYKREVIQNMVENYRKGITPNPDVLCNRKVKFGSFATWALEEGADFVATGHYAKVGNNDGVFSLLRGADAEKDQSYFLWQLTPLDLKRVLFPIGHMTKDIVRVEATRRKLPVAKKHDSQGLCFVGDITLPEFLSHYISLTRGPVVDEKGSVIGEHDGAALYTVGQRHGFSHKGTEPHYVCKIDVASNTVTVSPKKEHAEAHRVSVVHENWIQEPRPSFTCTIQVRYRDRARAARTEIAAGGIRVTFDAPCIVATGQSLVWYDNDTVLGGAVITKTV